MAAAEEEKALLAASRVQEEEPTAMDTTDVPAPTAPTHSGQAAGGSSRLSRLQSLLTEVTHSLDSNAADFLPDRLLTDRGTIDLNLAQRNIQHIQHELSNPVNEFANFKVLLHCVANFVSEIAVCCVMDSDVFYT